MACWNAQRPVLAAASTGVTFWVLDNFWQISVLVPIMGFVQLALFGGYALSFPELFSARAGSTGKTFCYDPSRPLVALGPAPSGCLTSVVFASYHEPMPCAGITRCAVYILGVLALPIAPETHGTPLAE